MPDMLQMQEQSRKSFFQWHVLLVMKKKQLQRTLSEAGVRPGEMRKVDKSLPPVMDSDELVLLTRFGLPIPDELVNFDLPDRENLAGIRFFFRATPAFDNENDFVLDFVRQLVDGSYQQRELIRVSYDDRSYLRKAAEKFNQALEGYSTAMVFNASVIWSSFHGAVVMDWKAVSARLLGVEASSDSDEWYMSLADIDDPESAQKKRVDLSDRKSLFGH